MRKGPLMQEHSTHLAMDDSMRPIVMGILHARAQEPELRWIPTEPRRMRRFLATLQPDGPVVACCEEDPSPDLYRQPSAPGIACQVIAPALAPGSGVTESGPIARAP